MVYFSVYYESDNRTGDCGDACSDQWNVDQNLIGNGEFLVESMICHGDKDTHEGRGQNGDEDGIEGEHETSTEECRETTDCISNGEKCGRSPDECFPRNFQIIFLRGEGQGKYNVSS